MQMNQLQWEELLKSLHSGNCCLMIGPELKCLEDPQGQPESVLNRFSAFLNTKLEALAVEYNQHESDFYYKADRYRSSKYQPNGIQFHDDIKNFTESHLVGIPRIYLDIARLPFISICSLLCDPFLPRAFRHYGFYFKEDHYNYRKQTLPMPELKDETQLLYYIYGNYNNPESVATTPQEQLELVRKIVAGDPKVPENIRSRFQKPEKSFLFIGFDFNDWHYRLIMKSLGIPKPSASYYPEADSSQIAFVTKEYYSGNLGITFLSNETYAFIQEFVNRYEKIYGAANRNIKIFIDYHIKDQVYFNELISHLKITCGNRNFEFLGQDITPGEALFDREKALQETEFYIPMLTKEFLNSVNAVSRINTALNDPAKKTILIKTAYVNYQILFGDNLNRATVLPEEGQLDLAEDLSQICGEIANTFNSIIR